MNNKKRSICFVMALICALLLLLAACNDNTIAYKNEYDWVYDPEFTDEHDDFMFIDGKLDEDIWTSENRNWMTVSKNGAELKYTTFFTPKGLYIAAHAQDTEIVWSGRFNFGFYTGDSVRNSAFMFLVANPDAPNLQLFSQYTFSVDTKNSCSYEQTHFTAKAVANGDVDNGEATEMTAELFVTWDALNMNVNPATGVPEEVCIIPRYRHIGDVTDPKQNYWIEPLYSTRYSLYSYAKFGQNGYLFGGEKNANNAVWGNSPIGTSHSYGWDMSNIADGFVRSNAPSSQAIFLSNTDAYSDRYIFSVSMQIDKSLDSSGANGKPSAGICNSTNSTDLVAVYLNGTSLERGNAEASRVTTDPWTQRDDFASCKLEGFNYFANNQTVRLTVMKDRERFYYLVEDQVLAVTSETELAGKTFPGVYSLSTQATFFAPEFKDYSNNLEEFNDILDKYVYRVEVGGETKGGSISVDTFAVDNTLKNPAVNVSLIPNNGYILTGFTVNGQSTINGIDSLSYIAQNIQGNTFELPLNGSAVINAVYTKVEQMAEPVTIRGVVKSVDGSYNLPGAAVMICDKSNPLLFAIGKTSSQGKFEFKFVMPKSDGYQIGEHMLLPGDSYQITVTPGPESTPILTSVSLADMVAEGYILVEMQAENQMQFVYLVSNSEFAPAKLNDDGSLTITAKKPASFVSLVESVSTENVNAWIASADVIMNRDSDGYGYMDTWNTYGFGVKFAGNNYLTIGPSIRGTEGLKLAYLKAGGWGGQLEPNGDIEAINRIRATYTESDRLNIKLWYRNGNYAVYLNNVLYGTYTAGWLNIDTWGEPVKVGYSCRLDNDLPKTANFDGITIDVEGSAGYNVAVNCTKDGHIWNGGIVVKQSGCTDSGMKLYTCTRCGTSKTEVIQKTHVDRNEDIKCDGCGVFLMKPVYLASNSESSPFEFSDVNRLNINASTPTSFISPYEGVSLFNQSAWIASTDVLLNKTYAGYYLDVWNTYGIGLRYAGNTYLTIGASIRGAEGLKIAYLRNGTWGGQLEPNADATSVATLKAMYTKSNRLNIKLWYKNGSYAIYLNNVLYGIYSAEQLGIADWGVPVQAGYACRLDHALPKTATFEGLIVSLEGTEKYNELIQ